MLPLGDRLGVDRGADELAAAVVALGAALAGAALIIEPHEMLLLLLLLLRLPLPVGELRVMIVST